MSTRVPEVSMARPIVLSNGELHVGINSYGSVHDLYYPYVGLENHAAGPGLRHRIGVYVDGRFSWLDDNSWTFEFKYPHKALIGHIKAKNEALGLLIEFDDAVDYSLSVFMRNIHVINLTNKKRDLRLFMHQAFVIGDSRSNTDTAQYLPEQNAILHYRGRRAFVISGIDDQSMPFDQHSIGLFGIESREGTWKDAEDGELAGGNVEHGRVDSCIRFKLEIEPNDSRRVYYWLAAGTSMREALYANQQVFEDGPHTRLEETALWWLDWLKPVLEQADKLPSEYQESFITSAMIIKSQIDVRGAIIASTDTSMLNYSRDTYSYSWPRDGSLVLWPLIRLGYKDEVEKFFEFCKKGMHHEGYLLHKYRADGALGSSWHPYIHDDIVARPIQEDETAIVVYMFSEYYKLHENEQLIEDFYYPMIMPMANFMMNYIDSRTNLPRPSYDLWEQMFATTTYTVAVVRAALEGASDVAAKVGDHNNAVLWKTAADEISIAAKKLLFNDERKFFYRSIHAKGKVIETDSVIDTSALFGSYIYGLFSQDSREIKESIETLKKTFDVSQDKPYLPRYEYDDYRREHSEILGNWWYICSLWYAQYSIATGDMESANSVLRFTRDTASSTHMIAEQYDPIHQQPIAPAPLTWSHAEYVSTLLDLIE